MFDFIENLDIFFSALMAPIFYIYYPLTLTCLIYTWHMNIKKMRAKKLVLRIFSLIIICCTTVYCILTVLLLYQRAGYALMGSIYLAPAFSLGLLDLYLMYKNKYMTYKKQRTSTFDQEKT